MTALQEACGTDQPGPLCTWLYDQTGNAVLSRLAGQVLPGLLRIVLILLLAWAASAVASRLIHRAVPRFAARSRSTFEAIRQRGRPDEEETEAARAETSRAVLRATTLASVLSSIATAVIWTAAVFIVLDVFGINLAPLIAGAGIVGVALGFGAQSLVKDFLSGLFMLLEDQYGVGDIVDVGEATGVVESISLRVTRLRDVEGTAWYVPNGQIVRVGNKSQLWARSLIDVGVAYDSDLDRAMAVIKATADELAADPAFGQQILEAPEMWGVESFGPNEVLIRLVLKVQPAQQWAVNRELRRRLKRSLDEAGIEIPFPQRAVWLRTTGATPPAET